MRLEVGGLWWREKKAKRKRERVAMEWCILLALLSFYTSCLMEFRVRMPVLRALSSGLSACADGTMCLRRRYDYVNIETVTSAGRRVCQIIHRSVARCSSRCKSCIRPLFSS